MLSQSFSSPPQIYLCRYEELLVLRWLELGYVPPATPKYYFHSCPVSYYSPRTQFNDDWSLQLIKKLVNVIRLLFSRSRIDGTLGKPTPCFINVREVAHNVKVLFSKIYVFVYFTASM